MTAFDPANPEPRRLRDAVGGTQAGMGALIMSPSRRAWQDWERDERKMPLATWELALLKAGYHPTLRLVGAAGA